MPPSDHRFDAPDNLRVFICERIRDGHPILDVFRDGDGDWQFLCGGEHGARAGDRAVVACLRDVVEIDPSVNELAAMCPMQSASREREGASWVLRDDMEDVVRRNVHEYGWHAMKIPGDAEGPPFIYTIGLYETYDHPEILCVGLPLDVAHDALWQCARHIDRGGKLEHGTRFSEAFENAACELRAVAPKYYAEYLGYAIWFYGGIGFPVVQLVWPDRDGRLPFEQGCLQTVVDKQPALWAE